MRTVVTITQKDPRKTKDENEQDAEVIASESPVNTSPVGGKAMGSVSWGQSFTLSQKFQTVKVECSVQLPVAMSLNPRLQASEVQDGLARAKELAEDAITASLQDQRDSLQSLISIIGR